MTLTQKACAALIVVNLVFLMNIAVSGWLFPGALLLFYFVLGVLLGFAARSGFVLFKTTEQRQKMYDETGGGA